MKSSVIAITALGVKAVAGVSTTATPVTTPYASAVGSCEPQYEEYICDGEDGKEYVSTYTVYPSGCPSSTYNPDYPTTVYEAQPTGTAGGHPTSSETDEDCDEDEPTGYTAPYPTGNKPSGAYPTGSQPASDSTESSATYQPSAQSTYTKAVTTTVPVYGNAPSGSATEPSKGAASSTSPSSPASTTTKAPVSTYTGAASANNIDSVSLLVFGLIGVLVAV